jgi:imidazolonepropionase-like amidohydrolase
MTHIISHRRVRSPWWKIVGLAGAFVGAFVGYQANAQTVAITGGIVATGDGSDPIQGGTVVMRDGKIVSVGKDVAIPANAERIDATGKWVTPGLFAGFSRLGLSEVEGVDPTNDMAAPKSPFSAALNTVDAINPRAVAIPVTRAAGVTRAVVVPAVGSGLFGGQGVVIDTGADMNAVTRDNVLQYVIFDESAAGAAGGSRSASWAWFRNAIDEARDYRAGRSGDDRILKKPDLAALLPVIDGKIPLMVQVEGATDILKVLRLKREYPSIRLILAGVTEGWEVAGQIAAANVPVVTMPMDDLPDSFDRLSATQSNAGRMAKAGVQVSFGQIGRFESLQVRLLSSYGGNMVALNKVPGATGMTWNAALSAITLKPAQMIGLDKELGSLAAGKRADIVIWDGDPLEVTSGVSAVWIDGVAQPLDTRQDKLRDRYLKPAPAALPKAYDR